MGFSAKVTGLDELIKDLGAFPKNMAKAERNAVDTTATATNKKSYEVAGNFYNIKPARLKKTPDGKKGSRVQRSKPGKISASIIYPFSRRPNLKNYKSGGSTKNTKKGVRFRIKKFDPPERLQRGFYVPLGGTRIVAQRKEGTQTGKRGTPILKRGKENMRVRTGPNMKQIMEEEGFVAPAVLAFMAKELERKTVKAVDDQLRKLRG